MMDEVKYVHVKIGLPTALTESEAAAAVAAVIVRGQTAVGHFPIVELIAFEDRVGGVQAFDGMTSCLNACTPFSIALNVGSNGGVRLEYNNGEGQSVGYVTVPTALSELFDTFRLHGHDHWVAVNLNDGMVV